LALARNTIKLTVDDISEAFGVDPRTVRRWEATTDFANIDRRVWVLYYCLLRDYQADPALINLLPVSRRFWPALR